MKCPYPDCQKDYNDENWQDYHDDYVGTTSYSLSEYDKQTLNRVYLTSRKCRFCGQLFHEIYIRHENAPGWDEKGMYIEGSEDPTIEHIASYPRSKTKFKSKGVPKNIREFFNEAEQCHSIAASTGTSACLRKTVYAVCDDFGVTGKDYREKIGNLPISGDVYKDLLKQVKFLGDNMTKPAGAVYTKKEIDVALKVLPVVIDKLYEQDEQIKDAEKVLSNVKSQAGKKKT